MRLFVAVWPPDEVVAELAALPRPEVAGLRWTEPAQWHVTLRFLGEMDQNVAADAFGRIVTHGSVAAELGPATGRFGRRVLHVPVQGLAGLAAATAAATGGVGEPLDRRAFTGHVTLARARRRRGVDLRPLVGAPVTGRWTVSEITLVASHAGGGGPSRYEVMRTLRLEKGDA